MSDIEFCEWCDQRPGVTNSMFWKTDDDDEGAWVCEVCENEFAEEHEEWAKWMYGPADRPQPYPRSRNEQELGDAAG